MPPERNPAFGLACPVAKARPPTRGTVGKPSSKRFIRAIELYIRTSLTRTPMADSAPHDKASRSSSEGRARMATTPHDLSARTRAHGNFVSPGGDGSTILRPAHGSLLLTDEAARRASHRARCFAGRREREARSGATESRVIARARAGRHLRLRLGHAQRSACQRKQYRVANLSAKQQQQAAAHAARA